MVDIVDVATRSRMMSGIRGKNTKPEVLLRKAVHRRGLRFRLHRKELPGTPDLVFPKWNAVVFVHGCFWHQHPGCRYATKPGTRTGYWLAKFDTNAQRDQRQVQQLQGLGWRVATVWECCLKDKQAATQSAQRLHEWLCSSEALGEFGETI